MKRPVAMSRAPRPRSRPAAMRPWDLSWGAGLGAALLLASVAIARADAGGPAAGEPGTYQSSHWLSLGLLGGSTMPDRAFADFQWDVSPGVAWGAQALAGTGRIGAGLRLWSAWTTQDLGLAAGTGNPTVRATRTELVGRGRLATLGSGRLEAIATAGRLHLGYHPDRVTFDPGGGSGPITVDLAAVSTWVGGVGLGLKWPLTAKWAAGLEIERSGFAMDTAHRNGDTIEYERRSFRDWSARLELAWRSGRW